MKHLISRRNFIKYSAASAVIAPTTFTFSSMSHASADDFKALVCINLVGGNDSFNMFIPADDRYNSYAQSRQGMSILQESLLTVSPVNGSANEFGFHPAMSGCQSLFDNNKLSVISNIGALITPTTKTDIANKLHPTPTQLFSHIDQKNFWFTLNGEGNYLEGWGGRLQNYFETDNAIPINISLTGNNLWQSTQVATPYIVSPNGAVVLQATATDEAMPEPAVVNRRAALNRLLQAAKIHPHPMVKEFSNVQEKANNRSTIVNTALANNIVDDGVTWPSNPLAVRLKAIVQLIAARSDLANNRQIFNVDFSDWDTHNTQLTTHSELLSDLSLSLAAFQQALENIGAADMVTTFTMSEFGRTLTSNGDGTDHGWGGQQLVMGAAVDGGKVFGQYPDLTIDGPDDFGRGRIIPTTPVDAYGATLATWFGVEQQDLAAIFPNLDNFDSSEHDIGFMR